MDVGRPWMKTSGRQMGLSVAGQNFVDRKQNYLDCTKGFLCSKQNFVDGK
jgi:hypothetical protein